MVFKKSSKKNRSSCMKRLMYLISSLVLAFAANSAFAGGGHDNGHGGGGHHGGGHQGGGHNVHHSPNVRVIIAPRLFYPPVYYAPPPVVYYPPHHVHYHGCHH
jgi:hypothetical protein